MQAIELQYKSGEDSIIKVTKPTAKDSEVLVKVKYSAIDTATKDVIQKTLTGYFIHARTKPLIVGWHYSGIVEAVGTNVDSLTIGDKVWGFLQYEPKQNQGSFSEYITVKSDECAHVPKNVSLKDAAAAATEALTALQAMRDHGGLNENKSILILGAGGGVGSVAVQIAKNLGAHVTGVCSTKDVSRVKSFGADIVIDRTQTDVFTADTTYDVIFDTPSKYSPWRSFKYLKPKGTVVVTIPSMGLLTATFLSLLSGKKASFVEAKSIDKDLEIVGGWLSSGALKVDIDSTYSIKDIGDALKRQDDKRKVGRIMLEVEGGW